MKKEGKKIKTTIVLTIEERATRHRHTNRN
jgi:hypothetical protein